MSATLELARSTNALFEAVTDTTVAPLPPTVKPEPLIVSPVPELIVIPSPVVAEIASFEPVTLRLEPAPIVTNRPIQ